MDRKVHDKYYRERRCSCHCSACAQYIEVILPDRDFSKSSCMSLAMEGTCDIALSHRVLEKAFRTKCTGGFPTTLKALTS